MTVTETLATNHGASPTPSLREYTRQDARDVAMIYLAGGMTPGGIRKSAADPEHIRRVRTAEALPEELRPEPIPDDGSLERMLGMIADTMDELITEGFDAAAYRQQIEHKYGGIQ